MRFLLPHSLRVGMTEWCFQVHSRKITRVDAHRPRRTLESPPSEIRLLRKNVYSHLNEAKKHVLAPAILSQAASPQPLYFFFVTDHKA